LPASHVTLFIVHENIPETIAEPKYVPAAFHFETKPVIFDDGAAGSVPAVPEGFTAKLVTVAVPPGPDVDP
jgi:hypothetical protein